MSLDKVLQKLQSQIASMLSNLENFTDTTVQPSVNECIELQKQLNEVQEQLAVYKFQKSDKELSPSFHIHSKISEVTPISTEAEAKSEPKHEPSIEPVVAPITPEVKEVVMDSIKHDSKTIPKNLTVAINDKFRFINELFLHNAAEYNIAVEQINNLHNWHDCELYLNSLKNLYNWKEHNETVKQLFSVVKKRFD